MEHDIGKMESQLEHWRLKIERLADEKQRAGSPGGYYTLMHIDEMKALHAVARTKLDEFKAGNDLNRARLMTGMMKSLDELGSALKKTKP